MDGAIQAILMWAAFLAWILGMFNRLWWKPWRLRKHYEKQGIRGPPFRPVVGNLLELRGLTESVPPQASSLTELSMHRVAPEIVSFFDRYGKVSVHEVGSKTRVILGDVELAREVLSTKAAFYEKADLSREAFWRLLGNGLVFLEGDFWCQQRRIMCRGFRHQCLKGFCNFMKDACENVVVRWKKSCEGSIDRASVEIEVSREMSMLTLDTMSRALFGSSEGGKKHASDGAIAFECLSELFTSSMRRSYSYARLLPGYSLFPTIDDWRSRGREKFVNSLLENIIRSRMAKNEANAGVKNNQEEDILGVMLDALYEGSRTMSVRQLTHESKTLFFAGYATTSVALTWCLTLLSMHQQWQDKARNEIQNVFGDDITPDIKLLGKLKIMGMILNETLRLYPPVSTLSRKCTKAHHIGGISILPDTLVLVPTVMFHQSEDLWGDDVSVFKPDRFDNTEYKDFSGFMPFGGGPRACLGNKFASMEVKLVLSMLLNNFSFSLSPRYRHAPGLTSSMRPQYGVPLIVTKL